MRSSRYRLNSSTALMLAGMVLAPLAAQALPAGNVTIDDASPTPHTQAELPAAPLHGWLMVGDTIGGQSLTIGGLGYSAALLTLGNTAASTNNTVLITGAGTTYTNTTGTPPITGPALVVGDNSAGNTLTISGGAVVTITKLDANSAYDVHVGYRTTASNNLLTVTGAGSRLAVNESTIYVGYSSSSNQLSVTEGGTVTALQMRVGGGTGSFVTTPPDGAFGNIVIVSGAGSSLTTAGSFVLGANGATSSGENLLMVTDGGTVSVGLANSKTLTIGQADGSNNNIAAVVGTDSVLTAYNITVGSASQTGNTNNALAVGLGGQVVSNTGITFNNNSRYYYVLGGSTPSLASATGAVSISGTGTVFQPFVMPFTLPPILSANSGGFAAHTLVLRGSSITGTFASNDFSELPALSLSAATRYTANEMWLDLTSHLGSTMALNGNQRAVAGGINNAFNLAGAGVPGGLVPLYFMDQSQLPRALTLLSGEVATGAQQSALQMGSGFLGVLGGPLPTATEAGRLRLWLSGFGNYASLSGNAGAGSHRLTARDGGLAMGAEYALGPQTVLGVALGGAASRWSVASGLGTGDSDTLQLGLYGRTQMGAAYLSGALAFGNSWMGTSRSTVDSRLKADFTAQTYSGRIEAGYRLPMLDIGLSPYAALEVQNYQSGRYSETGATRDEALAFNGKSLTDTRSELGLRFQQAVSLGEGNQPLTLRMRTAWLHDYNPGSSMGASLISMNGSGFTVTGASRARDAALLSGGLDWQVSSRVTLSAGVNAELSGQATRYNALARLSLAW